MLSPSVAIFLISNACSIHLFIMLIGNPLSVNMDRKLFNSSWSSDGVHIRMALDANDLMVTSLCIKRNFLHKKNETYIALLPEKS